jgi:peptide/nickel transport system ATP-binding protein
MIVLYQGEVMETGASATVTSNPRHPYTQALVAAAPVTDVERQRRRRDDRKALRVSTSTLVPMTAQGCPFASRCSYSAPVCVTLRPTPVTVDAVVVACHRYDQASGHPDLAEEAADAVSQRRSGTR